MHTYLVPRQNKTLIRFREFCDGFYYSWKLDVILTVHRR